MEDFFDEQNNQGFFESFSDVALCTLTVTLVLLSLLATSVRQSLNITLNENMDTFTMIGISFTFFIGTSIILWIMMFILAALAYVFPCLKPIFQCCEKVINSK